VPIGEAQKLSAAFLAAGVNLLAFEPTDIVSELLPRLQCPHLLRLAALTGETLTSLRVRDALGAVRALAAHAAVDPQAIYLLGPGRPGRRGSLRDHRRREGGLGTVG
jgi:hypothetical protein